MCSQARSMHYGYPLGSGRIPGSCDEAPSPPRYPQPEAATSLGPLKHVGSWAGRRFLQYASLDEMKGERGSMSGELESTTRTAATAGRGLGLDCGLCQALGKPC